MKCEEGGKWRERGGKGAARLTYVYWNMPDILNVDSTPKLMVRPNVQCSIGSHVCPCSLTDNNYSWDVCEYRQGSTRRDFTFLTGGFLSFK